MDLHAFWNKLHAFWNILEHSACIPEHSGTFWMHSACILHAFWNILNAFWNSLEHGTFSDTQTDGQTDNRTCWAASVQLKTEIFKNFDRGPSWGPHFFSGLQWFCCDILTYLDPKSFSLALRIVTFSFGHKKVIWSTLPFLRLQNIFWVKTGQNSSLNSLLTRKIILDPPLAPYQIFLKNQFFGLVLPKMWSEKKILQTLWVLYLDWQLGQTH